MKRTPWRWLTLPALLVIGALLAWLVATRTPDDALSRVQRAGLIRIGYAVEAPYIFLEANGQLAGLEYETGKAIAARLGISRTEWLQTEFGSLIPELEAGRFDVIVAGMFITPERAQRAIFSQPTFHIRQALLVQGGNPFGLHSYEDLRLNTAAKVAVLRGAVEEDILLTLGVPDSRIVRVPDARTGRVAVESGLADALALSLPTIQDMAKQNILGRTEMAAPFQQPALPSGRLIGFGGVAFRKADAGLCAAWNQALAGFVGSPDHLGMLARFGFSADDLPGATTTEMILSSGTP